MKIPCFYDVGNENSLSLSFGSPEKSTQFPEKATPARKVQLANM